MSTARACDWALDAVVTVVAGWTVLYHISLLLGLDVYQAAGIGVVVLLSYAVLSRRGARLGDEEEAALAPQLASSTASITTGVTPVLVAAAAAVAAVSMAISAPWPLVWVPWLLAAGAGTWWAYRARAVAERPATVLSATENEGSRVTVAVVLAWSFGLAVMAMFILRPNPDDLYYLNLSQWTAEHGTFPLRDTLYADLTYPMSNWPPLASYDGLVGAVAHLAGTQAATVGYQVVPPLATALSVLALWRLLRAWRVPHVALTLTVALVFLLFDGTSAYGPPGNLFVTRLWQGKVILLCLLVPTLLVYGLRYVERPSRATGMRLLLAGVASVGLSTTAIFLTPVIALAAMAPLWPRAMARAASGFALTAGYALAAGVVTTALGGRSADAFDARRLYRFDAAWIGHQVFLTGALAAIAVSAVLLGCLLVPHPAARVTTGMLVIFFGLILVPGATRLMYAVTGLGPTLWRISWGCSVAALVGVAVVWAGTRLRRRWAAGLAAALSVTVLVAFGSPIWAGDTGSYWKAPLHWQRSDDSRWVAEEIVAASRPNRRVLGPDGLAITVAVTTTEVKTVAPRDYYMHYLRDVASFQYAERLALVRFANGNGPWRQSRLSDALRLLRVEVACVEAEARRRGQALVRAGYSPMLVSSLYRCLRRE